MKLFLILIIVYALFLTTACPSKLTLENAARQSSRIAGYADQTTDVVRELYRAQTISLAQKDAAADKLISLAQGGKRFDEMVARLQASFGGSGNVPKPEFSKLLASFNAEVVNKFLDVLGELRIIQASEKLRKSINLLIVSIKIIARAFGTEKSVGARIAEAL